MGLYRVDGPVLWHDELATLNVIRRPTGAILAMLHHVDAVHGAYYLLMHFWTSLAGDSLLALRLPSVLAMAGAAACVALSGQRMFDRRAGLISGLVFALIPAVARYAQEVRSYGLVVLTASLALLMLLRALERPTAARWLAYAPTVAVAGYLHLISLGFLAAHLLAVAIAWWRDRRNLRIPLGFAAAVGLGLASLYPLLRLAPAQAKRQISWVAVPTADDLVAIWPQLFCSTALAVVMFLLALFAWRDRRKAALAVATASAVLPVLAIWALSQRGAVSYFMPKYLFFVLPAWALLAGVGVALLRARYAVAALVVLAATVAPDQVAVHRDLSHAAYTYPKPVTWFAPLDYRAAARIVAQGYRPGDAAAYGQDWTQVWWGVDTGVEYYLPATVEPRDVLLGETGEQRNDLWSKLTDDPAGGVADAPRIWLVSRAGHPDPFDSVYPAAQQVLRANYRMVRVDEVSGITVALLVRN
ncbi:glycosyltransferase family 39 protein [Kitasatospora sp. NPDC088346]|uniref:glycosyltransferase family 39 protein n=1 Tax=Kitasatospora sp. NPDC088346 TaxID=3364073 RepID=UPI0037F93F65